MTLWTEGAPGRKHFNFNRRIVTMQQTLEQLKHLRLNGFIEALGRTEGQTPLSGPLSFDERLALLVEREYLRRHTLTDSNVVSNKHSYLWERPSMRLILRSNADSTRPYFCNGLRDTGSSNTLILWSLSTHRNREDFSQLCPGIASVYTRLHGPLFQNR